MLNRGGRRPTGDNGASLLIAIVFVFAVGLWTVSIVQLAYPNLATSGVVSANRATNYDADAALAWDITKIRYENLNTSGVGLPQISGVPGHCPTVTYPSSSPTVTVLCTPKALVGSDGLPAPYQRYVQLQVCSGVVASCASPLATADVHYYDDVVWGRAAYVNDWSTR